MKRATSILLHVGALLLIPLGALAQRTPPPPAMVTGDVARRDVRVSPDVPSISGVWIATGSNRSNTPADGSSTPFLPWAQEFFEKRLAAERAGSPLFDPTANCLPSGVPRIISSPYPIEIVQTPDLTIIITETLHEFRLIHMDGQPKPADFAPSYFGYSVGHWEGDTLVVVTKGISDELEIDTGWPHSDQFVLTERIHLDPNDPDVLINEMRMEDPEALAEPFEVTTRYRRDRYGKLLEFQCSENDRNPVNEEGETEYL